MNAKELREKSVDELNEELVKLHKEQFQLRTQNATGQLGQAHLLKATRREIARVNTVLNEKAGS